MSAAVDPRAAVLARHNVVILAAAAGTLDALRPEAVVQAVVDLAECVRATPAPAPAAPAIVDGSGVREFVLASREAAVRGFRNALAFRRWCRARGVALHRDKQRLWVRPEDVDRAHRAEAAGVNPAPAANDTRTAGSEKIEAPPNVMQEGMQALMRKAG